MTKLGSMKIVLDCNAYDILENEPKLVDEVHAAISVGELTVIAPNSLWWEIWESPHRELLLSLPAKYVGDSVMFSGGPCNSSVGGGTLYRAHLGASRKHEDALIVDAADYEADYLVSQDHRLRKRMNEHAVRCKALSFLEWRAIFNTMRATLKK
jgi:hypothetical protein